MSGAEEKKEQIKKLKPTEVVQTPLADRFNQLQGAENAWRKKVGGPQWVFGHLIRVHCFSNVKVEADTISYLDCSALYAQTETFGRGRISSSAESAYFPEFLPRAGGTWEVGLGCNTFGSGDA